MPEIFSGEIWAALATLTILEIVLGIDNVIFVSIAASRLPKGKRRYARRVGLAGALGIRVLFLALMMWLIGLSAPLFTVLGEAISWRDIILIAGGLFLLWKATTEIHAMIENSKPGSQIIKQAASAVTAVIFQIMALDIVFSIDSILTAIGLSQVFWVMVTAIVISMIIMMWAAEPIAAFIEKHPTVKMLALAFLLLIGMALVADGLDFHIPRGYLYFAVAFSLFVEALNLAARRGTKTKKK